ncbi:ATP-binding protein [Streptomyces sp. NPDC054838]
MRLPAGVRVEVHDVSDARPVAAAPDAYADGGRGLFLVAALADRWAVGGRGGPGKRLWAELDVKGAPR